MAAAADCLLALKMVACQEVALPMSAYYPVLRTAIEGSSLAAYLLAPRSRAECLRRSYRIVAEASQLLAEGVVVARTRSS